MKKISLLSKARSSHPEVFLRKGVLKICSKFTGDTHDFNTVAKQLY